MQSVLISSKNKELGREEAEKIFRELKIDKFDIAIFEFEKAIGIQDIRELQKGIYLKPVRSEIKGILIDATNAITIEAQNALLKTLEEAPEDTIIIMQVMSAEEILPTILSRCKIIELKSKKEIIDVSKFIKILSSNGVGEKLKLAQDLAKDKNESLDFLENLIIGGRKNLVENYRIIKMVQKFHTIIKTTNVNLRLALENLFINL